MGLETGVGDGETQGTGSEGSKVTLVGDRGAQSGDRRGRDWGHWLGAGDKGSVVGDGVMREGAKGHGLGTGDMTRGTVGVAATAPHRPPSAPQRPPTPQPPTWIVQAPQGLPRAPHRPSPILQRPRRPTRPLPRPHADPSDPYSPTPALQKPPRPHTDPPWAQAPPLLRGSRPGSPRSAGNVGIASGSGSVSAPPA